MKWSPKATYARQTSFSRAVSWGAFCTTAHTAKIYPLLAGYTTE